MKNEFKIFLTALMFYTRFPVKKIDGWSEEMLNKSTRYFPLTGILVGGSGALAFWSASMIFSLELAVIISMIITIFFTGAFHEDGFTDFCDGFGGGYTREKILEIMKDSRIGTYGSIGLIMILGTKFTTLIQFQPEKIPVLLISGHAFSRLYPVFLIYSSNYVRLDLKSKVKPIGKADSFYSLLIAILFGVAGLVMLSWKEVAIAIAMSSVLFWVFRSYVIKRSGGYTGDVLGALQQLTEVIFYLSLVAINSL